MNPWESITVTGIDSIVTVPSERGRRLEIFDRKHYGLSFCADGGQISYSMNGQRYLSNRTQAILLPMHGCYVLHGDAEGSFPLINFYTTEDFAERDFLVCPLENPESYLHDYEQMLRLWLTGGSRARVMSLLYGLLARLGKESESPNRRILEPAMELLRLRLGDPTLSVAELAREVNLSEVYFRRLFRETRGVPPKQYLTELRIRTAKQLLSEHTASVGVIAEQCGFASVYHFCRAFKLATGMTPTEFARNE